MMEVKITFTPIIKRLTMEDIRGLDPEAVSAKEKRELYKKLNIELNDNIWEEAKNEQGGGMGGMMDGMPPAPPADQPPTTPKMPPVEPSKQEKGSISPPKIDEPTISPPKDDFTMKSPKPDSMSIPKIDQRKPTGETLKTRLIKEIATESKLSDEQKIEAIKALERIPLPPSAISTSTDLYVGQGVDDEGKPEITDPEIRDEFGLGEDEQQQQDLPPNAPIKQARTGDKATLGEFEKVTEDEFNEEIGNYHQGGTGNDGINKDSDGSFKDPTDANNDLEVIEEETAIKEPHARPVQEPMTKMSGGSEPFPDNTKDQIIGSPDDDEPPYAPSELDPNDLEKERQFKFEDDVKDKIEGEDPFTSGTSEDPNPEPEERKEFPRIDDQPLTEEPNTFEDTDQDVVGDTSQARLHLEDQGLENPDRLQDSRYPFDNTGLNVKPEYETVSEDDFKQVQTGEDPLEEEGEPLEDGMIVKPEDVRQREPDGFDPENPATQEITDDEYNEEIKDTDMNDPTISGIDEEQVDPDILHQDPETGKMYTDLTDEQGNEVPDLRFDQTQDSDEKQPEVELEFEIITKDEYDQEMSQDDFDKELENPNIDKPNPFDLDNIENPLDPVETDEEGNPIELEDVEGNELDEYEQTIDDMTDRINKLEQIHKLDKKISKIEDKRKATVKDIIKREHDLLEKGVPEEEIDDLLEQEFGDKRFNSAKETKTWRKAHGE
jgi:hypothetical protein